MAAACIDVDGVLGEHVRGAQSLVSPGRFRWVYPCLTKIDFRIFVFSPPPSEPRSAAVLVVDQRQNAKRTGYSTVVAAGREGRSHGGPKLVPRRSAKAIGLLDNDSKTGAISRTILQECELNDLPAGRPCIPGPKCNHLHFLDGGISPGVGAAFRPSYCY